MKGFFIGVVTILLTVVPALTLAQDTAKKQAPAEKKTLSATGTVSAVTDSSLTVKAKTGEMVFAIDKETDVIDIGAGRKSAALKKAGKPTVITEFVQTGDTVAVRYHDLGATKHAASVRVTNKAK